MIVEVPTAHDFPHFSQETILDGKRFTLTFKWNDQDSAWYCDVEDTDGPIAMGRRLVPGWLLLARCVDPRKPAGELMLITPASADGAMPAYTDLGDGARVMYFDAEELGRD